MAKVTLQLATSLKRSAQFTQEMSKELLPQTAHVQQVVVSLETTMVLHTKENTWVQDQLFQPVAVKEPKQAVLT